MVKKTFRLNSKKLFLTYPQCPVSKSAFVAFVTSKPLLDPAIYIVAQEEHKDGNKHLYIYLEYTERFQVRRPTVFDIKHEGINYHPNIQSVRSKIDTIKYVVKHDNEALVHGINVEAFIAASTSHKRYFLALLLLEKKSICQQVVQENPMMLYGLCKLANDLQYYSLAKPKWLTDVEDRKVLKEVTLWDETYVVNPRYLKMPQLWIYGPPNTGKTTFLENLRDEGYRGYCMPDNNDWSGFDDAYDFLFIDEFNGQIMINVLNRVLDGSHNVSLNVKGGKVMKNVNVPVFIVSNYHPNDIFTKVDHLKLQTLITRLKFVKYPYSS